MGHIKLDFVFIFPLALILGILPRQVWSFSDHTGYITPAELTITVTQIGLYDTSNSSVWVMNKNTPITFKASAKDFSGTRFSDISVPPGRYIGAQINYTTARSILLNGYQYQGPSGSSIQDGNFVCSHGSSAWDISTSNSSCPNPTQINLTVNGGATNNYFENPICVATSPTDSSNCQSGDTVLKSDSDIQFNVLLDLYNSVQIDADSNGVASDQSTVVGGGNLYPTVVFGGLGAALHLSIHNVENNHDAEASLIFNASKTLISSFIFNTGGTNAVSGLCAGQAFVTATAAPTGKNLNTWGLTFVGLLDPLSNNVAVLSNDSCNNTSAPIYCTSPHGGIQMFANIARAAETSIKMNCYSDANPLTTWNGFNSTSVVPYLGYTYTGYPGNLSSSDTTIKITKVADPSGIFNISTCGPSDSSGCGTYPQ